ncbi:nucleotide exchange factor GrpE [Thermoactinomyces sp. DSM 45892]|uniref:nucleotide exchange factor GrpE n=1 Tax=Thermoactinomyces sp. DSM 45892 TaxID=1882753 RepID=UPI000897A213|nr:nucleotide exchange factor GrpE [Thermoactinomyces sp. DSM 45892]SDY66415.1 molecular chaperone GrpE [Thermoactinomyces sp. DSM 45892]
MSKEYFDPSQVENTTQEDGTEESSAQEQALTPEEVLLNQLEQAQVQLEELHQKAEEHQQNYLRALADLENYRRRARKEKEDILKYASVPLVESLLPVLDNFERALDAADGNQDVKVLQEGIEMVYRQFLQALSKSGLTLIEAVGKPFNPHEHNAVMQVEMDEVEPGTIVEELQSGYKFSDRIIRPSMVKVSQ